MKGERDGNGLITRLDFFASTWSAAGNSALRPVPIFSVEVMNGT